MDGGPRNPEQEPGSSAEAAAALKDTATVEAALSEPAEELFQEICHTAAPKPRPRKKPDPYGGTAPPPPPEEGEKVGEEKEEEEKDVKTAASFAPGKKVRLKGLKARPELNGEPGEVLEPTKGSRKSGRVRVLLVGSVDPGSEIGVKTANLAAEDEEKKQDDGKEPAVVVVGLGHPEVAEPESAAPTEVGSSARRGPKPRREGAFYEDRVVYGVSGVYEEGQPRQTEEDSWTRRLWNRIVKDPPNVPKPEKPEAEHPRPRKEDPDPFGKTPPRCLLLLRSRRMMMCPAPRSWSRG